MHNIQTNDIKSDLLTFESGFSSNQVILGLEYLSISKNF